MNMSSGGGNSTLTLARTDRLHPQLHRDPEGRINTEIGQRKRARKK